MRKLTKTEIERKEKLEKIRVTLRLKHRLAMLRELNELEPAFTEAFDKALLKGEDTDEDERITKKLWKDMKHA